MLNFNFICLLVVDWMCLFCGKICLVFVWLGLFVFWIIGLVDRDWVNDWVVIKCMLCVFVLVICDNGFVI